VSEMTKSDPLFVENPPCEFEARLGRDPPVGWPDRGYTVREGIPTGAGQDSFAGCLSGRGPLQGCARGRAA